MQPETRETPLIYCDHNATTPLRPDVLEAMMPYLRDDFGNPSSVHSLGSRARCAVEEARAHVAALVGASAAEIVFTAGGTESNNLAILGSADSTRIRKILVGAIEHSSVRAAAEHLKCLGSDVVALPVDDAGRLNLLALERELEGAGALVSVAWANNEVGTIQPVPQIGKICHAVGARFHVDAVQAAGKVPVSVGHVDLLSVSAHKLGGPKGVGALFVRKGIELTPRSFGGGQERGRRSGTENVAGIVGLGEACRLAQIDLAASAEAAVRCREELWTRLSSSLNGIHRNTPVGEDALPNTLHVSFEGIVGEALVAALDLHGIAVSSGSACAAGAAEPSHVLLAMGRSDEAARHGLRFSFGRGNSSSDVEQIAAVTIAAVLRVRQQRGDNRA